MFKVEFQGPLEGENSEGDKYIAYFTNPILNGMVESGKDESEAFTELIISLAVKIHYDNKFSFQLALPKPQASEEGAHTKYWREYFEEGKAEGWEEVMKAFEETDDYANAPTSEMLDWFIDYLKQNYHAPVKK